MRPATISEVPRAPWESAYERRRALQEQQAIARELIEEWKKKCQQLDLSCVTRFEFDGTDDNGMRIDVRFSLTNSQDVSLELQLAELMAGRLPHPWRSIDIRANVVTASSLHGKQTKYLSVTFQVSRPR